VPLEHGWRRGIYVLLQRKTQPARPLNKNYRMLGESTRLNRNHDSRNPVEIRAGTWVVHQRDHSVTQCL